MPWGDLLQAAIRHAVDGIPVSPCQSRVTARATDLLLAEEPAFAPFRATYLDGGAAPAPGRLLAQPRLGRTLERLAREGGRAFYEGDLAAEIGRACEAIGSPLREEDLAAHRSRWAEPATVPYRGGVAASVPPPCQGLVALAVLGMLDGTDVRALARAPADYVHLAVEATKLAFGDRDRWLADPERRGGAARTSPRSGLPPGARPADRDGPRRARAAVLRHRPRRHDRLRHGRRGRELRVA